MTALTLYVRSRRGPAALGTALAGAVTAWLLAAVSDQKSQVTGVVLPLTVLVLVAVLTTTLGGPDDALDRTAARPWGWLRMAHLAAACQVSWCL
ncbi:hypothetical protein ACQF4J_00225 [Streptomyces sp. C1-1]|uniref:hypothetical protein n=1 Tax=Streptomyces sp. C1-1 TaxID=3231173 RepID=UPI003D074565